MRKYIWLVVAAIVAAALSVGVATANAAKGGNSENAKLCQKGGWQDLVREDGSTFVNQGACVSYAAQGGTLMPKPACTAGSENFSDDAGGSQPTTFAGGTIDTPYANSGRIRIQGDSGANGWDGAFAPGTHVLYIGQSPGPFRLTFTNAVSSVELDLQAASAAIPLTLTLKAYDSSDAIVDTDALTVTGALAPLFVSSATNNIKYFTVEVNSSIGLGFSNIVWGCA